MNPAAACVGGAFQKLSMSRENRTHRWFERWCRGRRVCVEPELLGTWFKVMSEPTSRGRIGIPGRLIWGDVGSKESELDPSFSALDLRWYRASQVGVEPNLLGAWSDVGWRRHLVDGRIAVIPSLYLWTYHVSRSCFGSGIDHFKTS